MSVKEKTVLVSEASNAVGESLVMLAQSVKTHLADGFQPGQDVPAVIGENITSLLVAMSKASAIPAEPGENLTAFMKAWAISGVDVAGVLLEKKAAPEAPQAVS